MFMKQVDYRVATLFVQERHYSPVMPKLTKHYLGAYQDDELVGILTLGWGTNPMGTIKKMFPILMRQQVSPMIIQHLFFPPVMTLLVFEAEQTPWLMNG